VDPHQCWVRKDRVYSSVRRTPANEPYKAGIIRWDRIGETRYGRNEETPQNIVSQKRHLANN